MAEGTKGLTAEEVEAVAMGQVPSPRDLEGPTPWQRYRSSPQ